VQRRNLILAGVAGAAGFAGVFRFAEWEHERMTAKSVPPWHLWGNEKTLQLTAAATLQPPIPSTQQMVRAKYKRPESWHFLFSAEVIDSAVAAGGGGITVNWDLTIGIGLNTIVIPGFVQQGFPIVGSPTDRIQIWTATAKQPPQFGGDVADSRVSTFVAQDVQLQARIVFNASSQTSVTLRLAAQVSPVVHVRPDWWQGHYPNELDGM